MADYLGRPFPVQEDIRFVAGRGRYVGDLSLPRMLHLAVVPAPVAHARIEALHTGEAEAAPGVVRVITGAELRERIEPVPQNLDVPGIVWYPLAVDKVRFAGEWLAAVVAESRAQAEDAAELVYGEFSELPVLVDPEDAIKADAPAIHEAHGSNIAWENHFTWGPVDEYFAAADQTFRYRYRWGRHAGVPLETFGTVATLDMSGELLEVWASHQTPNLQGEIARVLRRPQSSVRVHQDLDVGGSYGSKRGNKQVHLTSFAAIACGRPVRFIEDRTENMVAGDAHGPDRIFDIALAVMNDGEIRALDIDMIDDVGAYVGRGPLQMSKPTTAVVGPYLVEAVRYGGKAVVTNKTNQAPFRGFGQACHNFILERSIDRVARSLGLSRTGIRERNYIQPDQFPYRICSGATYDSGNFPGALAKMSDLVDLPSLQEEKEQARRQGKLLGVGIAGCLEPSGGNQAIFSFINEKSVGMAPETARIQVDAQGDVIATIGFQSTGQSHESMVRQILCHELGVEPGSVRVQRGDSLAGITGTTPLGSRMTMMLTRALVIASGKIRGKLTQLAAFNLGVEPGEIERDGTVYAVASDPARCLSMKDLAHIAYHRQVQIPPGLEPAIVESGTSTVPGGGRGLDKDKRLHAGFPSVAFSVHVPVVEIDPDTFQVRIRDYYVVHDCGTVINPLVVEGMVYGGIAHGIGGALFEKFAYDEAGQLVASSFMDYLMPTAAEMPPIRVAEQVTPSPLHPYGAKGTGEGGYMTAPAAIASAVEDALTPLGVEIDEIPMSPDLLFSLVHAQPEGPAA